jgi:putative CocE/NonD family hydrolase
MAAVRTAFPRVVREIEHALIPLRDGTKLAARVWLPVDAEQDPVPAVLEYLPYRKRTGTYERDALNHPYIAGHGYACVRVDVRGSGESEGLLWDEYAPQEQDDAVEVIEWLAAQPWCNGGVGMMGISWGGFNALQVAARRPPALKAIVTVCSTDDRYRDDVHYMGGAVLRAGFGWASFLFGAMCHPPDPALSGDHWRSMWMERLKHLPLLLEVWLHHQWRDAYWRHGSACEDYGAIQCPVYAVGGWTDGYTNVVPRLLEHLTVPRKGLIGPWAHDYPHTALPGPQVGFLQEALRWWDRWLKGIDTGVMHEPMLRAWMTASVTPAPYHDQLPGRWIAEPAWPPPNIVMHRYCCTDQGLVLAGGPLTPRQVCSAQTVGKHGGTWCPFGRSADQAGDQREDDAASLVFDSAPLAGSIDMLGAPVVALDIAADRPVANLAVRLCDVHPDGASQRVSFGVLNLTHREGHATPVPLTAGKRYKLGLMLNVAGATFAAGHRIRVAISTAYWPMIWPPPETATVTVFAGELELPVRPARAADALLPPLPPAETASAERTTELRPGVVRIDRLGLELGTESDFRSHIDADDPLSAVVEMCQTQTVARGGWRVRIETAMCMSCTREAFVLRASLRAFEREVEVCRREWDRSVPRRLV